MVIKQSSSFQMCPSAKVQHSHQSIETHSLVLTPALPHCFLFNLFPFLARFAQSVPDVPPTAGCACLQHRCIDSSDDRNLTAERSSQIFAAKWIRDTINNLVTVLIVELQALPLS